MKNKKISICSVSVLLCAALMCSSCGISSRPETSDVAVIATSVSQTTPLTEAVEHTDEASAATISALQASATQPSVQALETITAISTETDSEATTAPTVPTPLQDNSERDTLFADRVRTPYTVVKMAGNVKYTVTFDREEYYLGDDINLRVKAENVGTEPIIVPNQLDCDLKEVIRVKLCVDGIASENVKMGYEYLYPETAPFVTYWEPGTVAEEIGRLPTYQGERFCQEGTKVTLLISVGGSHYVEIPIKVHGDLPQDNELFPYLRCGTIDTSLYQRALVMDDDETIPVVIPRSWNWEQPLPNSIPQPVPGVDSWERWGFDDAVFRLSRLQLLALLEYQAPVQHGERETLKYVYATDLKDFVISSLHPIDGV